MARSLPGWLLAAALLGAVTWALAWPAPLTQSVVQFRCMEAAAHILRAPEHARLAGVRYLPESFRTGQVRFRLQAAAAGAGTAAAAPPSFTRPPDYSGPRVFFACAVSGRSARSASVRVRRVSP